MGKFYSDKSPYRDPLFEDENGLYITKAQMQFFLNRRDGKKKFQKAHKDFMDYYNHCKLYNLIYDMMEENKECADLFWDAEKERVAISFPVDGGVAHALSSVGVFLDWGDDDEEDDDQYNLFS